MKDSIDWNICPPEILCIIFKHLDANTLAVCMLVNKQWRDIAEHTVECYALWEDIIKNQMINKGISFVNKSTLNYRNIFKNYMLWNHVNCTSIKHKKTYEIQNVKLLNVYKDNLILVSNSNIMYYNLKTFNLIRAFASSSLNFEENDHMIVKLVQEIDLTKTLYLYIKTQPKKFQLERSTRHIINDILLYRLEEKRCYVLTTTYVLWAFAHKNERWDVEFLARHYGSDYDTVTAIHVCNELVYIVTKWGTVWYADTKTVRFIKVYQMHVPHNVSHHNWVMFESFSYVVPVTMNINERVKVNYDTKYDVIILECSEVTCALQHGDVLFLGYNDGRVEIRIPKKYKTTNIKEPDRYFNIQQYYEHVGDSTIISINVWETENSHTLLVSTRAHIFQLQLTYSEYLL